MPPGYPDVEGLVPHRRPSLLLIEVRSSSEERIVCAGAIPADHPLADDSGAPAVLGIELAAQAAAAGEGLRRWHESPGLAAPVQGYLVSVARARFRTSLLPVGEPLVAQVRCVATAGRLSSYVGVVSREGTARAHLVVCRIATLRIGAGTQPEVPRPRT